MTWKIRPVEPVDYETLAAIRNQIRPEPMTGAEIAEFDQTSSTVPGFCRLVAERPGGQVVATAWVGGFEWMPEGVWQVGVQVDRAHRGQGLGEELRQEMERRARVGGARRVEVYVRGEDDVAYEWALKRGYYLRRQRTEATLDVPAFDFSPFAGAVTRTEATGITFKALPGRLPEELLRGAYELDRAATKDIPGHEDLRFPPYERWVEELEPQLDRTFWVLALDGERVVGFSNLEWSEEGEGAHTGMTGVLREYRGRGIALSLKLIAIENAKRLGFTRMRTNNDPDNPPMLAVNRKLGYTFIPGPRLMRKDFF